MKKEQINSDEKWFDIPSYKGLYQISNTGRIKRLAGNYNCPQDRLMTISPDKDGYAKTRLSKDRKSKDCFVHRLIAEVFLPHDTERKFVNHKDGDKTNNNLNNLEYVTHRENMIHAGKTGLMKNNGHNALRGSESHWAKIDESQAIKIKTLLNNAIHPKEISNQLEISLSIIYNIKYGSSWKHIQC